MSAGSDLAVRYFESILGKPLRTVPPVPVSAMGVIEILWSLNDVFRPFLTRIRTIAYDPRHERAADRAIELFVKSGPEDWDNLPGEVWRVLFERHEQTITFAMANHVSGNETMTFLPLGLSEKARLCGIMLSLLHSMKLPYPPKDRSDFESPAGNGSASMTLH